MRCRFALRSRGVPELRESAQASSSSSPLLEVRAARLATQDGGLSCLQPVEATQPPQPRHERAGTELVLCLKCERLMLHIRQNFTEVTVLEKLSQRQPIRHKKGPRGNLWEKTSFPQSAVKPICVTLVARILKLEPIKQRNKPQKRGVALKVGWSLLNRKHTHRHTHTHTHVPSDKYKVQNSARQDISPALGNVARRH